MSKFDSIITKFCSIGHVPDDQIEKILPLLSSQHFRKGDFFVRTGEMTSTIGFVESGVLRYYYVNPDGREYTRYFCQRGNLVASFSAMVTGEPSAYSIEALQDSKVTLLDYKDWIDLVKSSSSWAAIDRRLLQNIVIINENRELSLVMEDARTRYEKFLRKYPKIKNHVKQRDIATYLGITPVSLSRIRKQIA